MPDRTLQDLLRGRGAHVDPVACVEDVPWELAGRRLEASSRRSGTWCGT